MVAITDGGLVVGIKKGPTLREIVAGHDAQEVDKVREAVVVGKSKFGNLLERYEKFLNLSGKYYNVIHRGAGWISEELTPDEINQFLQTTVAYENHENYVDRTGIFISRVICDSSNAGNNDFILNTQGLKRINYLCCISSSENDPLKVYITGDIGNECCVGADGSIFTIDGDFGDLFAFEGGYVHSTFKTPNEETLRKLKIYLTLSHNLFFIHPDGREEYVRDRI